MNYGFIEVDGEIKFKDENDDEHASIRIESDKFIVNMWTNGSMTEVRFNSLETAKKVVELVYNG